MPNILNRPVRFVVAVAFLGLVAFSGGSRAFDAPEQPDERASSPLKVSDLDPVGDRQDDPPADYSITVTFGEAVPAESMAAVDHVQGQPLREHEIR